MGHAINKQTMREHPSVNVPDFSPDDFVTYNTRESHADYLAAVAIPRKYRKVVGNSIVEMDPGEKASVDQADLPGLKRDKMKAVRATTDQLRAAGFEHPVGSGNRFPLFLQNQIDWLAADEFKDVINYPFLIFTVDEVPVEIANQGELMQHRAAATGNAMLLLSQQNELLKAVWNAPDKAALEAITDER